MTHEESPMRKTLAGFVAARMADRFPPPHVVSSVGGIPISTVQSYIAGFEAGAKRADPKIRVLRAYSNTFLSQRPCANAASDSPPWTRTRVQVNRSPELCRVPMAVVVALWKPAACTCWATAPLSLPDG